MAWVLKNLPANAGDIRDAGRSPEEGIAIHSSIPVMQESSWTVVSMGSQSWT